MLISTSTDAAIIAVPMPMLWNLRVPLTQKLALGVLFSSGILVIICTILRTYYHFGDSSNQFLGQLWSGREGFISMIVIAVPGMWPFFRSVGLFGSVYKKTSNNTPGSHGHGHSGAGGSRRFTMSNRRSKSRADGVADFDMDLRTTGNAEGLWTTNSEERIIKRSDSLRSEDHGIKVTKEFTVEVDRPGEGHKNQAHSRIGL